MSCCAACDLRAELYRLRHSTLLHAGGYGIYRGLIAPTRIDGMLAEATGGGQRIDQVASGNDTEDIRGGQPARRIVSVEGGPSQDELFGSVELQRFVASEVNLPVRCCGWRASYSIYDGPQAHLGIHRDVPGCDLALITCLYDRDPLAGEGAIDLWLDDLTTPLRHIRAHVERRRSRLALLPGDSLLIHGGMIPHSIPPPGTDRLRIVSLMCFEIVT
jgi:hypothetical protein